MELHQMRYVAYVGRLGSVGRAAEELYVSRQAVSRAVLSLEKELGVEIFDRGRRMRPTEAGNEVLRHIDVVLREVDAIGIFARQYADKCGRPTMVNVAFKSFPLDYLYFSERHRIVELVKQFEKRTRECEIATFKMSDTSILNAVADGVIDIGFVQGAYEKPQVKVVPVDTVETRAITLKGQPLCAKEPLSLDDFRGVPLRSPFDFDLYTRRFIDRCRARGFEPLYREVPLNDEGINEFCRAGGVHFQPYAPAMRERYTESAFMALRPEDRDDLPLCMVYREDAANGLVPLLAEFVRNGVGR